VAGVLRKQSRPGHHLYNSDWGEHFMRYASLCWTLLAILPVTAFVGCGKQDGPELAYVTGKITLDGEPLSRVNLRFVPEQPGGSPSFGGTNASGQYKLLFNAKRQGAMLGKHIVEIEPASVETDENGKPLPTAKIVAIPKKYAKAGSLVAEVKAGSNTVDFQLVSK
jgi:hypothetical protein